MSALRILFKVSMIVIAVGMIGFLLRTFGFQFFNSVLFTSSAPPRDLDERLLTFVILMSLAAIIVLKDWIKK